MEAEDSLEEITLAKVTVFFLDVAVTNSGSAAGGAESAAPEEEEGDPEEEEEEDDPEEGFSLAGSSTAAVEILTGSVISVSGCSLGPSAARSFAIL